MASSRLRSLPSARRTWSPSPLPATAMPAESYPRYSSRLSPSRMTGTTRFLPTYPTMPHIAVNSWMSEGNRNFASSRRGRDRVSSLVFQRESVFLDDRVGQYFAGDPFHFRLGLRLGQAAVQADLEVFSLPDALQSFVAHLVQRALDRLALRIQNALL